jgi:hypothetical protein
MTLAVAAYHTFDCRLLQNPILSGAFDRCPWPYYKPRTLYSVPNMTKCLDGACKELLSQMNNMDKLFIPFLQDFKMSLHQEVPFMSFKPQIKSDKK